MTLSDSTGLRKHQAHVESETDIWIKHVFSQPRENSRSIPIPMCRPQRLDSLGGHGIQSPSSPCRLPFFKSSLLQHLHRIWRSSLTLGTTSFCPSFCCFLTRWPECRASIFSSHQRPTTRTQKGLSEGQNLRWSQGYPRSATRIGARHGRTCSI